MMRVTGNNYMSALLFGNNRTTNYLSALGRNRASRAQTIYQNVKNNAGDLQSSTTEATEEIKDFVTYYNNMVQSLKNGSSSVDRSYLNPLNSMVTNAYSSLLGNYLLSNHLLSNYGTSGNFFNFWI